MFVIKTVRSQILARYDFREDAMEGLVRKGYKFHETEEQTDTFINSYGTKLLIMPEIRAELFK